MLAKFLKNLKSKQRRGRLADPLEAYVQAHCRYLQLRPSWWDRLEEASFCSLDLETTGLDVEQDVIIHVGAVKIKKGRFTKIFESYVRPPFPVPESSIPWHGIRDDMLQDKPCIGEVLPELLDFIGASPLVGHHINFDLRMLSKHLQQEYASSLEGALWLDTMLLHSLIAENSQKTQLDELLDLYCIHCSERHRALGDAIATGRLFVKMLQELQQSHQFVSDLYRAQKDQTRRDNL